MCLDKKLIFDILFLVKVLQKESLTRQAFWALNFRTYKACLARSAVAPTRNPLRVPRRCNQRPERPPEKLEAHWTNDLSQKHERALVITLTLTERLRYYIGIREEDRVLLYRKLKLRSPCSTPFLQSMGVVRVSWAFAPCAQDNPLGQWFFTNNNVPILEQNEI